jgi:hypothetical protein
MAAEIHTEGLQYLLEVAFSEVQSVPDNFYVGLATDSELAENASLGDQTELSGNGYARFAVPSTAVGWVSAATGTSDRKVTSLTLLFSASGGAWSLAKTAFLATSIDDSGKLLASAPINGGSGYTLADGENYECEFELTLAG